MNAPIDGIAINAGSSSIRLAAFHCADGECAIGARQHRDGDIADPARGAMLTAFLESARLSAPPVVVHRIVHGGDRTQAAPIDAALERELAALNALAPLHNPPALAWVRACSVRWPQALQVAVFDTAFYTQLPAMAATYALPQRLCTPYGIKRYGFHGLAHASMWQQWRRLQDTPAADAKIVSLQLGSGCSITATRDGIAVDTSMGFSPLEGLVMATRSGDVDAGALLHLQRAANLSADELDNILNTESGLLGLSAHTGDMRRLRNDTSPAAQLAVEVYCYRARKYIGAYVAALGGIDAILFGGGVGEHSAAIRAQILQNLTWCGIEIDAALNRQADTHTGARAIHRGRVAIWVVPVDEEHMLAQAAHALWQTQQGAVHDSSSQYTR